MSSVTAPTLVSATPSNTSTAATGADIVLTFSAEMAAGNGLITISDGVTQTYLGKDGVLHTRLVGATDTRTVSITDTSQVTVSGNTVTINLASDLLAGKNYNVQMAKGALLDTAGNTFTGLTDSTRFKFTTATVGTPAAAVSSLSMTDTGNSTTDFITNSTAQTIGGKYTGVLATGDFIEVSLDNGASWSHASTSGDTWSASGTISASSTLIARVSNAAGKHSAAVKHAYTLDTTAPTVTSALLDKDHLSTGETATVTLTFSETVTGLDVSDFTVSGGALSNLASSDSGKTWTATLTPDSNASGGITLNTASVADTAGNSGPSATSHLSFSHDSSAPAVTITSAGMTDTGVADDDFITSASSQTITGTYSGALASGEYIEVSLDGGNTWHTATVADGGYLYSGATISASGTLAVRASNGTTAGTALTHAYTYDASAPAAPTIDISNDDMVLGDTATVTVTFGEKIASLSAASFSVSGASLGEFTTTDHGLTWTATLTPDEDTSGSGNILLLADAVEDLAGNTGPAGTTGIGFGYDTRIPSLEDDTLAFSDDTGDDEADFITYTGTQTVTGNYSNHLYSGSKIEVSADGNTWTTAGIDGELHQWSASLTLSGSGTLHVRLTDALGNVSEQTQAYTIDTTIGSLAARSVDLASSSDSAGPNGSSSDNVTNIDTPTVRLDLYQATGLQAGDYVDVLDLSNGSAVVGTHTITSSELTVYGSKVSLVLDQLGEGEHQLVMRARDVAGNEGTQSSSPLTVTVDTSAVSMASKSIDLAAASDSGASATDNITNDATPTVTVNVASTSGLSAGDVLQIVDASDSDAVVGAYTLTAADYGASGGDIAITLSALADGGHALKLQAVDKAGNAGAQSAATTVTIDTVVPSLLSSSPSSGATVDTGTSSITLTFDEALSVDSGTGFKITNSLIESDYREIVFEASSGNTGAYNDTTHAVTLSLSGALQYDGNYVVSVYNQPLSDLAGNTLANETSLLAFNSAAAPTPPGAVTMSLTESTYASHSGTDSDYITKNNTLAISGITASHLEYRTSSSGSWTSATFSGSTASITLPDGSYAAGELQVRQYNVAGYESTAATLPHSWTIDTAAPTMHAEAPSSEFFGLGSSFALSSDITGLLYDPLSTSGDLIEYTTDNGGTWRQATTTSTDWSISNLAIDSGGYIVLRATDVAGNVGSNGDLSGYVLYVGDGYGGAVTVSGNTTVYAMDGDDTITASNDHNTIDGGAGNDIIQVNGDSNTVDSGSGDNTLVILGADNTASMGSGADTITIAGDANTVYGGDGNDTFVLASSSANVAGNNGADTFILSSNVDIAGITGMIDGGNDYQKDTLILGKTGQKLTLANLSAHVKHMEKIQLGSDTAITVSALSAAATTDGAQLYLIGDSSNKIVLDGSEWTPATMLDLVGYSGYTNTAYEVTLVYSSAITIDTGVT